MTAIQRLRVNWTGFVGAPGVSTFYATDAATLLAPLHTFFTALNPCIPSLVAFSFETSGETISAETGDLTGAWTGATTSGAGGADTSGYSAPSGGIVRWLTGTIVGHRRLVGRTFLVPLADACYMSDGTLVEAKRLVILNAAAALVASSAGNMVVWSRPGAGRVGSFSAVNGAEVPDKCMILRSRRD